MDERINEIYKLRNSFSIIGLTGRKGAGTDIVAKILSKNFSSNRFIKPKIENLNNKDRKYTITYNFSKKNWRKYKILNYKNVLFFHLLRYDFNEFKSFISKNKEFDFGKDVKALTKVLVKYSNLSKKIKKIKPINRDLKDRNELINLSNLFFNPKFEEFVSEIDNILRLNQPIKRILFLQKIANNLRQTGEAYNSDENNKTHIYTIAEIINRIIKGYKYSKYNKKNKETHIVINSLRNSLEIMFFKERFSAFYMMAVNSDKRREFLLEMNNEDNKLVSKILNIDKNEYKGEYHESNGVVRKIGNGDFFIQDVQNCIQKSDIYLSNNPFLSDREKSINYNFRKYKNESLKSLKTQVLKYTSLILHPGLTTPSSQERSMQMAFNAKSNSGCISRQVGAVITNLDFSIKSVGWNDVPKNNVPCILKSTKNLINGVDKEAFSPYEKEKDTDKSKFYKEISEYYKDFDFSVCNGHNHSYCFKDFQNIIDVEKNQVHTRSLHAEENAMMQIAKYGGQPLNNGILFTTASPCELCSKKARQLEIKQIYYIDPYPGIAKWHILRDGSEVPDLILFAGAVGRAYNRLYEPIMSYKDELVLITGYNPKKEIEKRKKEKYK